MLPSVKGYRDENYFSRLFVRSRARVSGIYSTELVSDTLVSSLEREQTFRLHRREMAVAP